MIPVFSVIHQDTALISGSLRFCLDPTKKFTDDQLWHILQLLELQGIRGKVFINYFIHYSFFISGDMRDGLDTVVEASSGGWSITPTDTQLLSLARAMLSQPRWGQE